VSADASARVTITSSNFTQCSAKEFGGGVSARTSVRVNITSSHFTQFSAKYSGGGVFAVDYAVVDIANSWFKACKARYGGCLFTSGGRLTVAGSSFNNSSAHYGGCIAANGPTSSIANSSFTRCRAAITGGAIIVEKNASLTVDGCLFERGQSDLVGGCLAAIGASTFIIHNSVFSSCRAVSSGGAVDVDGHANMSISGSRFINNTCSPGSGGGMASRTQGNVDITSSSFLNCAAGIGGRLHSTGPSSGRITLLHTKFTGNRGVTSGGGVGATRAIDGAQVAGVGKAVIAVTGGCLFSNNTAVMGYGGDMYSDGSVEFLFTGTGNNIGEFSPTVVQSRTCVVGEVVQNNVCQECPPTNVQPG
jgi:hypothetical protein